MGEGGTSRQQVRFMLWAPPRTGSTAFYRAMLNRDNTKCIFEPFLASHFFSPDRTSSRYSSQEADPECTYAKVKATMEQPYPGVECVFAKNMSFPLAGHLDCLPTGYHHLLLICNPRKSLRRFYKSSLDTQETGWDYFDPTEAGFKEGWELVEHLRARDGQVPMIIDYDDLTAQPEDVLRACCSHVGADYQPAMLQWRPMAEADVPEVFSGWMIGWFRTLLAHTTICRPDNGSSEAPEDTLPEEVERAVEQNLPFYEKLYELRYRPCSA